jgi:hypothetical protein
MDCDFGSQNCDRGRRYRWTWSSAISCVRIRKDVTSPSLGKKTFIRQVNEVQQEESQYYGKSRPNWLLT